jgi:hypothetical protein
VIKNGGTPTRQHQFPIYTSRKKFDEACSRGLLKDISRSAEKVIRSLQPYTSETPDDTIFYVLQQYDNLDKHQLLLVVCTVARLGQKITIGENAEIKSKTGRMGKNPIIIGLGDPRPRKITKDGVVVFTIDLGEPAPELEAEAEFVPQVAFEKCGRAELIPVTEILPAMLQATANCVNALIGEF